MRLPRAILVLLPLLGGAYRPAAAQETAVVAGRIIAAGSGQALPGVNVRLQGTSRGAVTNTRGEFRIEQVAAGGYMLVADVIGFAPEERQVTVGAGELVRIDLLMAGQALEMSDLVVQGRRTQTVLKTDSPVRLVPQAVSVMPSELLDRQQVRELDAVLRNVSGVSRSYSTNYRSDFSIRGFDLDIYGSYRRNAVEYAHFVDPMTPAVERIEVLKGPSSVLYGGLEPGGVINIVTKQPLPVRRYEVALDGGSFGYARPRLDFTGPLFGSGRLRYRVNASYTYDQSFRDGVSTREVFVSPVLTAHLWSGAELTLETDYRAQHTLSDPGLAARGGDASSLRDVPRETFYGEPGGDADYEQFFSMATLDAPLGSQWALTTMLSLSSYRSDLRRVYFGDVSAAGMVDRRLQDSFIQFRYGQLNLNLAGRFRTGAAEHKVTVGLEGTLLDALSTYEAPVQYVPYDVLLGSLLGIEVPMLPGLDVPTPNPSSLYGIGPVDAVRPQPTGLPGDDASLEVYRADGTGSIYGLFVQDQITLGRRINLLLSGRFGGTTRSADRRTPSTDVNSFLVIDRVLETPAGDIPVPAIDEETGRALVNYLDTRDEQDVTAFTPAIGVVYAPFDAVSVYASYSRSFRPELVQVDSTGNAFDPIYGKQYEAGLKTSWLNHRLSVDAAAYDITKTNALSYSYERGHRVQTGEQRSRGIELSARGEPVAGLTVISSYAYTDARYTKDEDPAVEGSRIAYIPRHSGSVWLSYDISHGRWRGLGASIGAFHRGESRTRGVSPITVPGHLTVDVGASYQFRSRYRAQVKIANAFAERHYAYLYRLGSDAVAGYPAAPRSVNLTLTASF